MRDRGYIEKELSDKELNLGIRGNYDTFLQKLQIELLLDIREQLAKNNIEFVSDKYVAKAEDVFENLTNTPIVPDSYIEDNYPVENKLMKHMNKPKAGVKPDKVAKFDKNRKKPKGK